MLLKEVTIERDEVKGKVSGLEERCHELNVRKTELEQIIKGQEEGTRDTQSDNKLLENQLKALRLKYDQQEIDFRENQEF